MKEEVKVEMIDITRGFEKIMRGGWFLDVYHTAQKTSGEVLQNVIFITDNQEFANKRYNSDNKEWE